ncbi:MAG: hypothetical protein R3F22_07865 [Lysobacteraceae bacterium]
MPQDRIEDGPAATEPQNDVASSSLPLPRHTTPTWEVELLISGVAVFAMLQLPGWLNEHELNLRPRFDPYWRVIVVLALTYAKSVAVVLASTFVLHLLLRAQWIALVGMNSVYPDGVNWDELKMGPIQRALEQGNYPGMPALMERADNRASIVFAFGVQLATMLLVITTVATFAALPLWLLQHLGFELTISGMLWLIMGVTILPFLLAAMLDRAYGARWPADNWKHRWVEALFRYGARLGFGVSRNTTTSLISSHAGNGKTGVIIMLLVSGVVTLLVIFSVVSRSRYGAGAWDWLPDVRRDAGDSLFEQHYDSLRDTRHADHLPYIQSPVVLDPYLELRVPFSPARHNARIASQCGELPDNAASEAYRNGLLACLTGMHAVRLDGQPLAIRYLLGTDQKRSLPVLQAMIDIRALAPGEHELQVDFPPSSIESENEASVGDTESDAGAVDVTANGGTPESQTSEEKPAPPSTFDRIPFWR